MVILFAAALKALFPSLAHLAPVTLIFGSIVMSNVLMYVVTHAREFLVLSIVSGLYAMVPLLPHA